MVLRKLSTFLNKFLGRFRYVFGYRMPCFLENKG